MTITHLTEQVSGFTYKSFGRLRAYSLGIWKCPSALTSRRTLPESILKMISKFPSFVILTGVRDYIHVMDLASGHVAALQKLLSEHLFYNVSQRSTTKC
jgi:nucleoside-diphosphate-sugar epimerase